MPVLTSLPLNLSEILEARRGPLRELEIWALLCQCAEALQDLIIKGEGGGDDAFRRMITPNTLLVRGNGTIQLTENAQSPQGSLYIAPEFEPQNQQFISDAAFEKLFVYSLGRTLQVASEFGLQENEILGISFDLDSLLQAMSEKNAAVRLSLMQILEILGISFDLDSLLQAMSEKNAAVRLSLMQILEACSLQASQHPDKLPHSLVLSRLYKSILGSNHKSSFNDSNYGSDHSHEAVMSHQPGRARKPRPQVRHRHVRRKRASTSSSPSPNSRSRSRSRSPSRRKGFRPELSSGDYGWVQRKVDSSAAALGTSAFTTPTSSQILNTSVTSASSELSNLARRQQQAPPYSAAHSVQGLLGLRQGSPAFQKYIKLKERQMRRRQAKSGQTPSVLDEVRSRLLTSPLMSSEMMENISETHSMASLMSYTLGSYKPYLHAELGSEAALHFANDIEHDVDMSYFLHGMDYGYPMRMRAQATPLTTVPDAQGIFRVHSSWQGTHQEEMPRDPEALDTAEAQTGIQHHPAAKHNQQREPVVAAPLQAESCERKQRDFDGYEYVHNLKKPAVHVAMPLQGDSLKNATLARRVTVVHLTGEKFEVVLDPSSTARQLFDTVIPYLELDDFFFFGLTYVSEGEHFFLDADIKLHKVAPEGWKDGPKGHQSYVTFNLNVRLKFYPESPADFRHSSSQHLLYLQLRRDILEGRFITSQDLLIKLAGLALQAEYGDYMKDKTAAPESHQGSSSPYFTIEHYLPGPELKQVGTSVAYTKVSRRHKANAGMLNNQAELEFIKLVQSLPEYGIHFYKLSKSKSQTDSTVWIGLSQHSLVVAEPSASSARSVLQNYPWGSILKISFNKRRFSVQPKVEGVKGKPPKINFYSNSYRMGSYLLQFSTEQHRFEIRMKSRPGNMMEAASGVQPASEQIAQAINPGVVDVNTKAELPATQTQVDPALQPLPDDGDNEADYDLDDAWGWQGEPVPEQSLQYRSPPPYQPPRMAQILGGDQVFPGTEFSLMHASLADLHSSEFDKHHLQTLLDMSSATHGRDFVSASNDEKTRVSSPTHVPQTDSALPHGRRIFEVTLEKEENHGVGITIVGGETTSSLDLGIFVKSVVPGGPAERDGRIKCGDRLIAIGATSLEGKQHHEAVAMIRDSGPSVTFLVSQVRPPGTVKKRRGPNQSESAEFEKKLRDSMQEYKRSESQEADLDLSRFEIEGNSIDETLLNFDNFLSKHNSRSFSDDDHKCHSDEENYPLEPPPTPPEPYSPSNLSPTNIPTKLPRQQQQPPHPQVHKHGEQHVPDPITHQPSFATLQAENIADIHRVPTLADKYASGAKPEPNISHVESERELLKLQDDEDLARALLEESGEWAQDEGFPSSGGYHSAPLTEEEQEDLQILGDIAALEADGSSSDSDFDSAIKKTVDGSNNKIYPSHKAVNTVSPVPLTAPDKPGQSGDLLSNDVVYEVILEKDSSGFGIVAHQPSPQDQRNSALDENGVHIKEIEDDSPAQRGGILAPGDKILEVAGCNVLNKDSKAVQEVIDNAPNLTTVKVSRSMETDAALNKKGKQSHDTEVPAQPPHQEAAVADRGHNQTEEKADVSLSELIPKAPAESTPPIDDLKIVSPPPPLLFDFDDNSESNTQSDVDSDVLDSSKSDAEAFYGKKEPLAGHVPIATLPSRKRSDPDVKYEEGYDLKKSAEEIIQNKPETLSTTSDTLKLDGSSEFNEQLHALKDELDKHLERENASPNSLTRSSGSSSTESIVLSPRKIVQSLSTKVKEGETSDGEEERVEDQKDGDDDDDDDDDVVVMMYGNKPAKDEPATKPKGKRKTKKSTDEEILDPFEPVLLDVSLKRLRDGFGFTVAGGVTTGGCYIKQLVSEPALSDGRLRPGDKILQVNGQDTTSLGHVETVTLLRKLPDVARLKLLRFPSTMETQQRVQAAQAQAQMATASPEPDYDESESSEEIQKLVGKASQPVQHSAKPPDTPQAIIYPYDYKGSLLAKPEASRREDQSAAPESSVVDGIDGIASPEQEEVIQVELLRPADSQAVLGITLAQREQEGQSLVCIKSLKAGGLASRDGRLRRGDAILQVNETSFVGLTVRQAVSYLREAGQTVVLTIARSNTSTDDDGSGDESHHEEAQEHSQAAGNSDEDDDITAIAEEASSLLQERPDTRMSEQYDSFRKAVTEVPVVLSEEWVNELPLMRMAVDKGKEDKRTILQSLADLVESGEPNETFKSIRQLKEAGSCSVGQLPENKQKNRYRNVLPYDSNRIRLSGRGEDKEYINASFIEMPLIDYADKGSVNGDGFEEEEGKDETTGSNELTTAAEANKCLKYIACQGPVEGTVSDLWALLWQEQIHVVVMLTQIQEGGKLKCFPYWPRSKADVVSVDDG
ncbi:tyrosine-protein phosphatase non-receptor type 13, partial [Plakobranchus ocellatus]